MISEDRNRYYESCVRPVFLFHYIQFQNMVIMRLQESAATRASSGETLAVESRIGPANSLSFLVSQIASPAIQERYENTPSLKIYTNNG